MQGGIKKQDVKRDSDNVNGSRTTGANKDTTRLNVNDNGKHNQKRILQQCLQQYAFVKQNVEQVQSPGDLFPSSVLLMLWDKTKLTYEE